MCELHVVNIPERNEYWMKDFDTIKDEVGERPAEKLPFSGLRIGKSLGQVLSSMLDGKTEYEDVFQETGIGRPSFRLALQKARRNGMVAADLKLTQLGRWCAIAFKINASFIEFCVLADMYFYRGLCWDLTDGYPKGDVVVNALNLSYYQINIVYRSLVIKKHIRCRIGIKHRFAADVLYLDDGLFMRLHEYMEDMFIMRKALK